MRQRLSGIWSYAAVAAIAMPVGAAIACSATSGTSSASAGGSGARPMDSVTTHGEWVQVRRGADSIRAYVAYPERKTKAPAVIIIHEIFGLTDWEPTVADRLARGGYVAIVPDLLSSRFGPSPASADSGRKLVALLQPAGITADLDAVYAYVNRLPAVERDHIGTIGFCWGGGQSFSYATRNPRLKAAVVVLWPATGQRRAGPHRGAGARRVRRERRADRRHAAGGGGHAQVAGEVVRVQHLSRYRPRIPEAGPPGIRRTRGGARVDPHHGILRPHAGPVTA